MEGDGLLLLLEEIAGIRRQAMFGPGCATHPDPTCHQHFLERSGSIVGRVFDGQGGVEALLAARCPAKKTDGHGARPALDPGLDWIARSAGREGVIQGVVSGPREPGSHCYVT